MLTSTAKIVDNTLNIQIQSSNNKSLDPQDMPYTWLSNPADYENGSLREKGLADPRLNTSVHWLTPYWKLSPGLGFEAEAGHSMRRFVSSSIFHDVIAQRKPVSKIHRYSSGVGVVLTQYSSFFRYMRSSRCTQSVSIGV